MTNTIQNLQHKIEALQAKRDNAFKTGNFNAVNRYTKQIVQTQNLISQIKSN